LELADLLSANDDLESVTPELRAHPYVLAMRWRIYNEGGQ
jgi:hypothetical protein